MATLPVSNRFIHTFYVLVVVVATSLVLACDHPTEEVAVAVWSIEWVICLGVLVFLSKRYRAVAHFAVYDIFLYVALMLVIFATSYPYVGYVAQQAR